MKNRKKSKVLKNVLVIVLIAVLSLGLYSIFQEGSYSQDDEIIEVVDTVENQGEAVFSGNENTNMKVSLITNDEHLTDENESSQEKINLEAMRDEQVQMLLDDNGLTMYDYANSRDQIADAVLLQVEKILKEYDEKIKEVEASQGRNGEDGKPGKDGTNGKDGKDGMTGATGRAGSTGKPGKDGVNGKDGKDGADGKSVYIRYSEYSNGANMTTEPNGKTCYFGTYSGVQASSNPEDYTWAQYKDMVSYYTEADNTLHFVIP